jgi:hypothetical protein
MPLWIKGVAVAVTVAAIAFIGWKVNEWRHGYNQAVTLAKSLDDAKADLEAEVTERERIDGLRAVADATVLDYQERERIKTNELKAKVGSVVADRRDCDFGDGAIRVLNDARGYQERLPGPTKHGSGIPEEITKDTGAALN